MPAAAGVLSRGSAVRRRPGMEAVRREFRRSRSAPARERWSSERVRAQLPRVSLEEALAILLEWRADPPRFEAGALAWHARLAAHAPRLTFAEAQEALEALRDLRGPRPEDAAVRLSVVCRRHGFSEAADVLEGWHADSVAPRGK
jgi:hypothetical protein